MGGDRMEERVGREGERDFAADRKGIIPYTC